MSYRDVFAAFGERAMPGLSASAKLVAHKGSVESGCRWHWRRVFRESQANGEPTPYPTTSELFRDSWFVDAAARYSEFGVFAWADQPKMTVHLWHDPAIADRQRLTAVLGHELGHLAETMKLPRKRHPDYCGHPGWRDEWRADMYGEAACLAGIWADKLTGYCVGARRQTA
jgi:hypothetical protein